MKDNTERHLSRWAPALVAVLGSAVGFGASISRVNAHMSDANVHMSYDKKIQEFVPRNEIESIVKLLNDSVQMTAQLSKESEGRTREDIHAINAKLDKITEILLRNNNE
jgi:hypothetical protein